MYGPIDEAANTEPSPASPERRCGSPPSFAPPGTRGRSGSPAASTQTEMSSGERRLRKRSWSSRRATGFMSPAPRRGTHRVAVTGELGVGGELEEQVLEPGALDPPLRHRHPVPHQLAEDRRRRRRRRRRSASGSSSARCRARTPPGRCRSMASARSTWPSSIRAVTRRAARICARTSGMLPWARMRPWSTTARCEQMPSSSERMCELMTTVRFIRWSSPISSRSSTRARGRGPTPARRAPAGPGRG